MEDIENAIQELEELIKWTNDEQVKELATELENWRKESRTQINEVHNSLTLGQLGKNLHDLSADVAELSRQGKSKVTSSSSTRGALLRPRKLIGATNMMKKIWDHLMDDNIRKIRVYGAKGVGKTIVMKHINDCLIEDRNGKFDRVIWVTVSKEFESIQLQNYVAIQFGLNLSSYKDVKERAAELHFGLLKRNRYVIILDDMCKEFHPSDIGIPEPTLENECKLIFTTSSDVCDSKQYSTIHMGFLSAEEVLALFIDHVGHDTFYNKGILDVAEEIFKEYCCLPLSIVKVANFLAGKMQVREWRSAFRNLKKIYSDPDDKVKEVTEQLKSAYPCLKSGRLYDCLLYCALFPKNGEFRISKIVNVLGDLGIIEDMPTVQEQVDEGNDMLDTLTYFGCLEYEVQIDGVKTVEIHDIIRYMVKQITRSRFIIEIDLQFEGVAEMNKWSKDLENLSLVENNLEEIPLNASLKFPKLLVLILHSTSLLSVSASFFEHLNAVKILDLSCTKIKVLPDSISDLVGLVALLLNECSQLCYVPSLRKMKGLRRLNLSKTSIRELPVGLTELTNLRFLSLWVEELQIPEGSFSKLSQLQALEVLYPVRAEELMGLTKLEHFSGTILDIHSFNGYINHKEGGQKLGRYEISVGGAFTKEYTLDLRYNKVVFACVAETDIRRLRLPEDVEALVTRGFNTISSLEDIASCLRTTPYLRAYFIWGCDKMRVLLTRECCRLLLPFPYLELLVVCDMPKMLNLISREAFQLPPFHYSCLKYLLIGGCPELEEVFQIWFLEQLKSLEKIRIEGCKKMVRIIGGANTPRFTLPRLKVLAFCGLPLLENICPSSSIMICNSLEKLFVKDCPKLKRIPFCSPVERRGQSRAFPRLQKVGITAEDLKSMEWPNEPNAKKIFGSLREDPSYSSIDRYA